MPNEKDGRKVSYVFRVNDDEEQLVARFFELSGRKKTHNLYIVIKEFLSNTGLDIDHCTNEEFNELFSIIPLLQKAKTSNPKLSAALANYLGINKSEAVSITDEPISPKASEHIPIYTKPDASVSSVPEPKPKEDPEPKASPEKAKSDIKPTVTAPEPVKPKETPAPPVAAPSSPADQFSPEMMQQFMAMMQQVQASQSSTGIPTENVPIDKDSNIISSEPDETISDEGMKKGFDALSAFGITQ